MNTRMDARPIIDVLQEAILNGDPDVIAKIQEHRAAEAMHVRVVMCTSEPGGIDLDLELGLHHCEYVTPVFEGPRAQFISRHTSLQSRLTGGSSGVLLDYSIAFDSNFAEKLRAMIHGEAVQAADRDRIVAVLKLRAHNPRVQFDVIPFLMENARLAREDRNNERPLNTLVAFRMLDHLDWDAFRDDTTRLVFREGPSRNTKRVVSSRNASQSR